MIEYKSKTDSREHSHLWCSSPYWGAARKVPASGSSTNSFEAFDQHSGKPRNPTRRVSLRGDCKCELLRSFVTRNRRRWNGRCFRPDEQRDERRARNDQSRCRAQEANSAIHILRLVGLQPEANPRRIPQSLRDHGLGLPIQHPIAKAILDESDLPVTYLNSGATFMDNFFWMISYEYGLSEFGCVITDVDDRLDYIRHRIQNLPVKWSCTRSLGINI